MDRSLRPLLIPTLLALLLGAAAAAQDEPGGRTPASLFVDRVDVNVVNVEVFVTDRGGRRVAGLTADDFEIFEDGRPVEISNFYAVSRPEVEDRFAADRALVTAQPAPARPELPDDQQLSLLVYVDNFNLRPASRNRVLSQIDGFLEDRIDRGDRVMLVAFNGRVDVVAPFTEDRRLLLDGVQKIRKMAGYRQIREVERREVMRTMRDVVDSVSDQGAGFTIVQETIQSYIQSAQQDLGYSLKSLRDTTRSLAGLPGRKALLYVSDGLPQNPGQELYQHMISLYPRGSYLAGRHVDIPLEITDYYQPEFFQELVADANAHQVTIYTLDAGGSAAGGFLFSAETGTLGGAGGGTTDVDTLREANLKARMIDVAERTGGMAIRGTLNFDGALARVGADFDSFYSLGYRSPRGGDDKYHRIEVRVKRPGLIVRHRAGYVDKPEEQRVADRTLSSLLLEVEANPLEIGIDFGPSVKTGKDEFVLPIIIRIPVRDLALLPQGEMEQGQLRIFLAVRDEEGRVSDLHEIPLPVSFPREKLENARRAEIGYRTNLKIGKGTPKVAVGVWDELSGTESYVHKRVLVDDKNKV
jgi:VWFA-related protein